VEKRLIARVYTLTAAVIWGTSFVVIRWGLAFVPAMQFLFLRFLIASMIMLVGLITTGRLYEVKKLLGEEVIIFAALLNALGYIFQFLGQQYTIATNASLLVNTSAIFVAIFAHFMLKEKLNLIRGVAVLIALIGTFMLITNLSLSTILTKYFLGDILCLLSGASWGLYIVYTKKIAMTKVDDYSLMAVWFVYTTIFVFPLVLLQGFRPLGLSGWLAILYTSILCTIIGFLLWFNGLKILEAVTSSIYFLLEVVISACLEFLIFGLSLTFIKIVGALMICIGVILTDISYRSGS